MHSTRHSSNSLFSCFLLTTSLLSIVYAQNTYQGCYALDTNLVVNDTSIYQSTGRCSGEICGKNNYAVFGLTSGSQCWCGNEIPDSQVTPDHCNLQCPGYPADNCNITQKQIRLILGGGVGYLSVWLTGLGKLVGGAATDILTATTTRSNPSKTSGVAGSNTVYITAGRRSLACSVDI